MRELASEATGDARFNRIAALVIDVDDALVPIVQLAENVNRSDLSPLEIADGAGRAISAGVPSERVANNLGWNRRQLNRYLQLHSAPDWLRAFAVEVKVSKPKLDASAAPVLDELQRAVQHVVRLPGLPFTHRFELITGFNALKQQDAERLAEGGDGFTPQAERVTRKLAAAAASEEWSSARLRAAFKGLQLGESGRPEPVQAPGIVVRKGRAVLDAAHAASVTDEDRARLAPQLTRILEALGFKAVMLRS